MDIIGGTDISGEVLKLIESSEGQLVLITPYFKPWVRLTDAIRHAASRPGAKVRLVVRGGSDREKQEALTSTVKAAGVEIEYLPHLHAKIYLSKTTAIVTSMNLLETSALNSWEIAIRFHQDTDFADYAKVKDEVRKLHQRAVDDRKLNAPTGIAAFSAAFSAMVGSLPLPKASPAIAITRPSEVLKRPPARPGAKPPAAASRSTGSSGHCIRCNAAVPLNPARPYCAACYASWARFQNPEYDEVHCHSCGAEKKTTMAKPLCRPCWTASS
jgi:hypothetical protein